jgi:uncharacterized membrane protein YphA (DoxX/SURF4 family)
MAPTLLAARLVLGCVFLISAAGKLRSSAALTDGIMDYRLLSQFQARLVARVLPPLELTAAALLLAGMLIAMAASVCLLLLIVFTAAVIVNLHRGRKFPCGCFGADHSDIGVATVIRNGLLMALAGGLLVGNAPGLGPAGAWQGWGDALNSPWSVVSVCTTTALAVLALFLVDQLDLSILLGGSGESRRGVSPPEGNGSYFRNKTQAGG